MISLGRRPSSSLIRLPSHAVTNRGSPTGRQPCASTESIDDVAREREQRPARAVHVAARHQSRGAGPEHAARESADHGRTGERAIEPARAGLGVHRCRIGDQDEARLGLRAEVQQPPPALARGRERRQRRLLEVDRGEHGIRQPAAEQGDARFVLFLAAAADQAAGIAAEQQAVAERRAQELRQPLDRRAVGSGNEGDARSCGLPPGSRRPGRRLGRWRPRAARRARWRSSRTSTRAVQAPAPTSSCGITRASRARCLDPVAQVDVGEHRVEVARSERRRAAGRSCARATPPARTSRRRC